MKTPEYLLDASHWWSGPFSDREIPFCFTTGQNLAGASEKQGHLIALESSRSLSCRDGKSLWKQTLRVAGRCIFKFFICRELQKSPSYAMSVAT